ncbi:MAG: cbiF [Firmicutes bacterium]|nr:cbiF [Bacillota bacterium]
MDITFVGAGPGDPELITIKGQKCLQAADIIIYAGSLVNPALLELAKPETEIYNSASMTLEEVIRVMAEGVAAGKQIVRLHTGDPSIYGAIKEQMDELDKLGISYEVIPGVSSFLATAAALHTEYTLPDVSQTVIITRAEGRTPMPSKEKLSRLAAHQATMCIFLSISMLDKVVKELLDGGYTLETPIAIVQKASWPEQRIFKGTLATICEIMKDEGVERTAMIVVGKVLHSEYSLSRLYSADFAHMFREAASD